MKLKLVENLLALRTYGLRSTHMMIMVIMSEAQEVQEKWK